jgi:hypothetical protein
MRISQAKELLFDAALESALQAQGHQRGQPDQVNFQVQGQRPSFILEGGLCSFLCFFLGAGWV